MRHGKMRYWPFRECKMWKYEKSGVQCDLIGNGGQIYRLVRNPRSPAAPLSRGRRICRKSFYVFLSLWHSWTNSLNLQCNNSKHRHFWFPALVKCSIAMGGLHDQVFRPSFPSSCPQICSSFLFWAHISQHNEKHQLECGSLTKNDRRFRNNC